MPCPYNGFTRPTKKFSVETDASGMAVGAVVTHEGILWPLLVKLWDQNLKGYLPMRNNILAILLAIQLWRSYLQHNEFVIFTDQKSLTQLTEERLRTHWQQKVFSKLFGIQYKVEYEKGT
jgi:hypothetical protein